MQKAKVLKHLDKDLMLKDINPNLLEFILTLKVQQLKHQAQILMLKVLVLLHLVLTLTLKVLALKQH
jgi:hypothetical protein